MSEPTKTPVEEAVEFVQANSTIDEYGKRNSTKSAFFDYMKIRGVPKAQVVAVADAESDYISAALRVATADLAKSIVDAKAAGNDPNDLRSEVRLPTGNGKVVATVTAHSTARVPRTGETIDRYGAAKVQVVVGSAVKTPAALYARDTITELMK